MNGWRPDTGPSLGEVVGLLESASLEVEGRLPWSSNLTFLVRLDGTATGPTGGAHDGAGDDDRRLAAVYKPASGEQSLWDFPDGLYRREVAAYRLSEALGWGLVPPTVVRTEGPFGPGSLQLFVAADYEQHYFTLEGDDRHGAVLRRLCAFDVVANNADRKSGHVLLGPDGRLWGIDHGLCFHRQRKLRTVLWDFAGEPVPADVLTGLAGVADEVPEEVADLLAPEERDALRMRAAALLEEPEFPEPRGDRPPYPWPLV